MKERLLRERRRFRDRVLRDHVLSTQGYLIATITSVFYDGSIEVKMAASRSSDIRDVTGLCEYLMKKHARLQTACGSGLIPEDQVCLLRGSTGLAILRLAPPVSGKERYFLVSLDHSQYGRFGTVWDVSDATCQNRSENQSLRLSAKYTSDLMGLWNPTYPGNFEVRKSGENVVFFQPYVGAERRDYDLI